MAEQIKGETINSVMRDLSDESQRISDIVGRLTSIGDRLEGGRPQEAASPMVDHPPNSMLDDLRRKRDTFRMLSSQLESCADRIDGALGGNAPSAMAGLTARIR